MSKIAETSRFPLRDRLRDFLDMARMASLDANAPAMGQLNNTAHPQKREDIEWTKRVDADGINAVLADFDTAEQISKDLDGLCQRASASAASRCLKKIRAAFPKKSIPELLPGEDDYAQCRYLAQLYIHRTHIAARQHMFYTDHQRYHSIPLMLDTLAIDAITTIISEAERLSEPEDESVAACRRRLRREGMTLDTEHITYIKGKGAIVNPVLIVNGKKVNLDPHKITVKMWRNMLGGIEYPNIDAACIDEPLSDQVTLKEKFTSLGTVSYDGCPKSMSARLAVSTLNEIGHAWKELKPGPLAPDTPLQAMEHVILRVRDALACRSRRLLIQWRQAIKTGTGCGEGSSDGGKAHAKQVGRNHLEIRQAVIDELTRRRKHSNGAKFGDLTAARRVVAAQFHCKLRTVETASKGVK